MSRSRLISLLIGGLGLAACSERVIVRAASDVLVTIEEIKPGDPFATAQVRYLFAKPMPLAEGDPSLVARMSYDAVFDCARKTWGHRSQALTLADGRSVSQTYVQPDMDAPTPGSLGDSIVQGVCDPTVRKRRASRRPQASLERDYLETMGSGVIRR
ncbi:MAG: hypothetical protein EON89_05005 [Brevundimonas sp.]|nr:MAG: hypothetical protein EON89_05005 [Brevundimonas sp.]